MRQSRLILCCFIVAACLASVAEAQPCYKRTDEHVWGNFMVKPMSDSTCFGQWYSKLYYYNYKTGKTLFSIQSDMYYPYPILINAIVSDILMYDSLLVVSWVDGNVYRILKVDFRGIVSEIPTGLDQIPMLKFGGDLYGGRSRKLNAVSDSIFLMSGMRNIYSFLRSRDTVICVDSMAIIGDWSALDMYGDTIVLLSTEDHEARFYHVDARGKITYSSTVAIDISLRWSDDVYFRYGNLYTEDGPHWRALLRTPEGFKLAPGESDDRAARVQPLFGTKNVIIVGYDNDEMWVYDQGFNLLCYQPPVVSPGANVSGIYGDKVFTANSSGISTWIPDTGTTSVTTPPVADYASGIQVWPNPSASGSITVRSESPTTAIELTDAVGRVVYRASQQGTGDTIIPTTFLSTGMYFVNALTENGIRSERVLILHDAR